MNESATRGLTTDEAAKRLRPMSCSILCILMKPVSASAVVDLLGSVVAFALALDVAKVSAFERSRRPVGSRR